MKLVKLKVENFASYINEEIDFTELKNGPFLLTGNNGAGKSTMIEMITVAIYNKCRNCESKGITIDDLITTGKDFFKLELTFEQDGNLYTIIREKNKKSQKLKLLVNNEEKKGKLTEIQTMINSIVKLDYDTFMDTIIIGQGEADGFMKKSPLERKKVITKILQLGKYEALEARTKELKKDLKVKIDMSKSKLEDLYDEIKNKNSFTNRVLELDDNITNLERSIEEDNIELENVLAEKVKYEQLKNQQKVLLDKKNAIDIKIANVNSSIKKGEGLLNEILESISKKDEVFSKVESIKNTIEEKNDIDKELSSQASVILSETKAIKANLNELNEKMINLRDYNKAECEFCGQNITEEYKKEHLEKMNNKIQEINEKITENKNIYEAKKQEAKENSTQLSSLKIELRNLEEQKTKIEKGLVKKDNFENRLAELRQELEALNVEKEEFSSITIIDVENKVFNDFELKDKLRRERDKLSNLKSEKSVLLNNLQQIKEKEIVYDKLSLENKENIKLFNRYEKIQKAWSKDGIQALIIDSALPLIEDEVNKYLGIMSSNEISIKFETQKEAKNGNKNETLDIIVSDYSGTRPYELYSGGQKQRINLATRIGLSKFLSNRADINMQFFFIDEGLGSLDDEGKIGFIDMINSISLLFEQIFVISHIDDIKEAFNTKVLVTKSQDKGSKFSILN